MSFDALTFGIEIECFVPASERYSLQTAIEVECGFGYWHVGSDGSLVPGDAPTTQGMLGVEIRTASYLLGAQAEQQIEKLALVLQRVGAKVNKTCGLHVHVGTRRMTAAQVGRLCAFYTKYEAEIDSILAPSRRGNVNRYCRSLFGRMDWPTGSSTMRQITQNEVIEKIAQARTVEAVAEAINGDYSPRGLRPSSRYHKVNLQCYARLGTIEFRQHQGTVEAHKIWGWVKFLGEITMGAKRWKEPVSVRPDGMTPQQAFNTILRCVSPETKAYLRARQAVFARVS